MQDRRDSQVRLSLGSVATYTSHTIDPEDYFSSPLRPGDLNLNTTSSFPWLPSVSVDSGGLLCGAILTLKKLTGMSKRTDMLQLFI